MFIGCNKKPKICNYFYINKKKRGKIKMNLFLEK